MEDESKKVSSCLMTEEQNAYKYVYFESYMSNFLIAVVHWMCKSCKMLFMSYDANSSQWLCIKKFTGLSATCATVQYF